MVATRFAILHQNYASQSSTLATTSRKTFKSSAETCNAVLQTSYNKNCPDIIAPDQTIRLCSPKNSPPMPCSSMILRSVPRIDARPGSLFMTLNTVSAFFCFRQRTAERTTRSNAGNAKNVIRGKRGRKGASQDVSC